MMRRDFLGGAIAAVFGAAVAPLLRLAPPAPPKIPAHYFVAMGPHPASRGIDGDFYSRWDGGFYVKTAGRWERLS